MSKISEIKNKLQYGDIKTIATIVGCSSELIRKVFREETNLETNKARKILAVAQTIIETRERLNNILKNS